jgi:hypothetical protein
MKEYVFVPRLPPGGTPTSGGSAPVGWIARAFYLTFKPQHVQ